MSSDVFLVVPTAIQQLLTRNALLLSAYQRLLPQALSPPLAHTQRLHTQVTKTLLALAFPLPEALLTRSLRASELTRRPRANQFAERCASMVWGAASDRGHRRHDAVLAIVRRRVGHGRGREHGRYFRGVADIVDLVVVVLPGHDVRLFTVCRQITGMVVAEGRGRHDAQCGDCGSVLDVAYGREGGYGRGLVAEMVRVGGYRVVVERPVVEGILPSEG